MKNYLIYYVFITLSIFLNSCTEGFKEEYSKLVIALTEVTAITTPTTDTTPDYTFSSTESGALTYGGSCSSSTTIATTGNNTITLNTLSVDTYADCTITVSKTISTEKSEKKLSGSLTITSFTVSSSDDSSSYSPGWQLIAKQVDSDNFTVDPDELFDSNARTTFLKNENDNNSSTFMSIGNLTRSNYADSDGKYKFKLVWDGMEMASEDIKEVTWTQTSWLTDSTTQGFQEIGVSGFNTGAASNTDFVGLALSTSSQCVIDGDGGTVSNKWFNCVGLIDLWNISMPGPLQKKASSMHLYIWEPEIKETNYALDFDGTNDYVSANGVATELDSSTNLPLSVSAWVYPENGTKEQLVFGFYRNTNSFKNGPSVWFGGSNYKFAYYNDSFTTVHSSSTYAINNWHHVVLTIGSDRDGVLYVNGSSARTFSGALNSGGLDMFSIGVDYDTSGGSAGNLTQYFVGKIDEVAVWNVALNAADVTSLYNSGYGLKASSVQLSDIVGYWKFNEGTGSTLTDNTSNSNNGTLTNMDNSSDWVTSGSETKPSFQ
jgi:hypothetical protein